MILTARFAIILASVSLLAAAQPGTDYKFRTFEVCKGCPTATGGINDRDIVGAVHVGPSGPVQGYLFNAQSHIVTPVPGTLSITVPSNSGRAPGLGVGPGGDLVPVIREQDGSVTVLDGYPGALFTTILQLNSEGAGIGYASKNFTTWFSFRRSVNGVYHEFTYPGPVGNLTLGTFLLGWNDQGTMVGYLADLSETEFAGLIRHPNGEWRRWNVPGSTSTIIYAITECGVLAGGYKDETRWHGFVWSHGKPETVDFPRAANTVITGINDQGDLAGETFDGQSPLVSPPAKAFIAIREGGCDRE